MPTDDSYELMKCYNNHKNERKIILTFVKVKSNFDGAHSIHSHIESGFPGNLLFLVFNSFKFKYLCSRTNWLGGPALKNSTANSRNEHC